MRIDTVLLCIIAACVVWSALERHVVEAYRLRQQRRRVLSASLAMPTPVAAPPPPTDLSYALLLCNDRGKIEHEVALHGITVAPETFTYAGKQYQRERRLHTAHAHDHVWEYSRVVAALLLALGLASSAAAQGGPVVIRNSSGTEIGTAGAPIRTDTTGSTTQPVSAASLPLPTGAATATLQGVTDADDASIATGQTVTLSGALNMAYDGSVWRRLTFGTAGTAAAQVFTVQGIAAMTPLLVTPSLPTGAATAALQGVTDADDASIATGQTAAVSLALNMAYDGSVWRRLTFGTAGTASAQVLTVQGVASMTPFLTNPGTAANWGVGATGAAVPANAVYVGANGSANLTGITACDGNVYKTINNTTTEIVALSSTKKVRVCSFDVLSAGTATATFKYGTGSNCGTGTTQLGPAWPLTAQTGIARGSGLGELFQTIASNALCLTSSAAVDVHVWVSYTVY